MPKLEALLFDVDGTLADTERNGHRVAFNAAFAAAGLDWHWSESLYGRLLQVTGGKERIRYFLDEFHDDAARPEVDEAFIAQLHREKTAQYKALIERGDLPLRPGVRRLLEAAKAAGLRLAIATTTTPENVTALLTSTLGKGAVDWFDPIAAGDVVAHKKPAPDIYLWALARLGLTPDACLAFEDSAHGAAAVTAAGIRALLVTVNGYTAGDLFPDDALVLDQLGEPDQPCRALQGQPPSEACVTLETLEQLHARANAA